MLGFIGDLRKLPQIERKQILSDLLGKNDIGLPVIYSEHLTGDGHEMFEHAAKLNFEGIVSKRAAAPYRSERTEAWLAIKTMQEGKFPVIGFVKDPTGVAALYLGKLEGRTWCTRARSARLVAHNLKPNSKTTRYRGQSEIEAHQADP